MSNVRRIFFVVALALSLFGSFAVGRATADQPHMQNALAALQTAQTELQLAKPNKGDHRDRAMELVGQAINQVQLGINYAR
ncbi:MAG: hypothetical protein FJX76_15585 [Armatimonadetes bacterium]|nr:hypothetical protein [Armatimonadota bacterium]